MKPQAAVIGLGRFGLFWAEMLTAEFDVLGVSRRTIAELPDGVSQVSLSEAMSAQVIFLTVSISALEEVLQTLQKHLVPCSVVIDTCSVKVYPSEQLQKYVRSDVDIIASHPMFGPDSAAVRSDMLPVVTYPVRNNYGHYAHIVRAFTRMHLSVHEMSPEEHDKEAAFTQGITHFMGRVFANMGLKHSAVATLGYTRLLQVMEQTCNDPLQLFHDLQRYNPFTKSMLESFYQALQETETLSSQHPSLDDKKR